MNSDSIWEGLSKAIVNIGDGAGKKINEILNNPGIMDTITGAISGVFKIIYVK